MVSPTSADSRWKRWHSVLFFVVVLLLSYFTYFHRYWEPKAVYWDENYHIASAQKYLHKTFFMEQHPPLGKMLIALGENMFHPNEASDQFLGTDYATDFSQNFSFVGYRFFSAFLAWWGAPVMFLIFLVLFGKFVLLEIWNALKPLFRRKVPNQFGPQPKAPSESGGTRP